jgi:hypothetical protein
MSSQAQPQAAERPWYAQGLRFGCTACGRCCGGAPGYVWVSDAEISDIAARLGVPEADFRRQYVRRLWRGRSLREKSNYDCVLLDGAGRCTVYDVRPIQCRTWPFWPSNLRSPEVWRDACRRCPGMGQGPLYVFEQIESLRMEMEL